MTLSWFPACGIKILFWFSALKWEKNKVESIMEMETSLVYVVGFKLSTRLYDVGRKNFGQNLRR